MDGQLGYRRESSSIQLDNGNEKDEKFYPRFCYASYLHTGGLPTRVRHPQTLCSIGMRLRIV